MCSKNYYLYMGDIYQGFAHSGSRHLRLWVAKILNVGVHNYFDVMTFFASVFFSYFFLTF